MVRFARPTSTGPPRHCNLDKKGVAAAGGTWGGGGIATKKINRDSPILLVEYLEGKEQEDLRLCVQE
jgi:hypothetical protein